MRVGLKPARRLWLDSGKTALRSCLVARGVLRGRTSRGGCRGRWGREKLLTISR